MSTLEIWNLKDRFTSKGKAVFDLSFGITGRDNHILRHTFCTRLANAGMNPKVVQYIMGHANITMTLNYYAHATYDSAKAEMERLAA